MIAEYVGNMDGGHAKVRMQEVQAHLDDTYFGWIGDSSPEGVFYYRIHSPVILIEFDHQTPVALPGPKEANRQHIHTVVRTPNGNDYGKDLLRQHYERHKHDPAHGHASRADALGRRVRKAEAGESSSLMTQFAGLSAFTGRRVPADPAPTARRSVELPAGAGAADRSGR